MAQFANMFEVNLDNRSYPVALNQTVSEGNVNSNRIGAYVYRNGAEYNLGGSCTGMVMRADGTTVPLTGVIDGNAAYVVLDQPSCAIPGPIQVAVNWVSGSNTTTLIVAYGTVVLTDTRAYVQPGTPIPDINTLLAELEQWDAAATKAVRYDTNQGLTSTQKTTARGNIDAAGLAQVVRHDASQDLTSTQKTQARENISAADVATVVRYDTNQGLTSTQKTTARGNIDAAGLAQVVRVDAAQSLTDAEKAQGRENIDAASMETVSDLTSALNTSPYECIPFVSVNKYFKSGSYSHTDFASPLSTVNYGDYSATAGSLEIYGMVCRGEREIWKADKNYSAGQQTYSDFCFILESAIETYCDFYIMQNPTSWGGNNDPRIRLNVKIRQGINVVSMKNAVAQTQIPQNASLQYAAIVPATVPANNTTLKMSLVPSGYIGASFAEIAENAGCDTINIIPSVTSQVGFGSYHPVSANFKRFNGTLSIGEYHTQEAGFKFAICMFDGLENMLGKGYKILVKIHNQSLTFPITDIVIADNGYNTWGNAVFHVINQRDLDYSALIDLDACEGITELSHVRLMIGCALPDAPADNYSRLDHTFEVVVIPKDAHVVATEYVGDVDSRMVSKAEMEEKFPEEFGDYGIVFWGDSLTAGAGGEGVTYCGVCANILGKSYKNCGVGGETEQTIAARQGGNNLMIPPGAVNGTYSFSQMLDSHGKQILPLRQGDGGGTVNPVIINGQECSLSLSGETYTISGYSGTLLSETPALFSGADVYGDITVIFVGTNGLGANSVADRICYIRSMLSRVGKKYVVLGISYGDESARGQDDAAMLQEFGNHFFLTRKMLVNYGLNVEGLTPTEQDLVDISSGVVPTSLRSDNVHLNSHGYNALGKMLASYIIGLGYID